MSDLSQNLNPAPIATFMGAAAGLRFHQVVDDQCAPAVNPRDYVLIAPVADWKGEGYYLVQDPIGTPVVYYCTPSGSRTNPAVRLGRLNPVYRESETIPYGEFQERVLGKVAMTCKMQDSSLLPKFGER